MKKVIYLVMFLSMCMSVNLYAQTKKQLREANSDLQHQVDSLSSFSENQNFQIKRLEMANDSLTNLNDSLSNVNNNKDKVIDSLMNVNQQLVEEKQYMQQELKQKAKEEKAKKDALDYINKHQYYATPDSKYCEGKQLCKKWAYDMAKLNGKSFKIVDIVAKENKKNYHYGSGEYAYTEWTVQYLIKYLLNSVAMERTFECKRDNEYVLGDWTCNWTMK